MPDVHREGPWTFFLRPDGSWDAYHRRITVRASVLRPGARRIAEVAKEWWESGAADEALAEAMVDEMAEQGARFEIDTEPDEDE